MNTMKKLAAISLVTAALAAPADLTASARPARATGLPAAAKGCVPAMIDNFMTGAYRSPDLTTGSVTNTESGAMLGGRRTTRFQVAGNPFGFPSTAVVAPGDKSLLAVSSGYKGPTALAVFYGLRSEAHPEVLRADLSCFKRFEVNFVANDLPLNINVEVKSASSPTVYQCGVNTEAGQTNGFRLEFPFDCFVTNDPAHPPVDWTRIDRVLLLIQSASAMAANDYAINFFRLAS
ncbi:hypothetical protein F0U44_10845 [Nocardioides humilatus]|uniref:NADH:ubiquinone oxidoreductase intermediate-associated protein 30 domain-containing protein n=1 Tax=Nocardioides humilatus TaxID=2607660 RepID=A0A5B1LH26_9ACTN|nr:hypothetical protein [Nocardioides humilatus]KAA1418959.1 hypothetical protein F0U44_10845 [Nocardioides humilatus]